MSEELFIPKTLMEAVQHFSDEDNAWRFLKVIRWADGVVTCPFCEHDDCSFIATRKSWRCCGCNKQFSIKSDTIFQGSPLPLSKWMICLWLVGNARNGISSYELAKSLGVSQQTSWFMAHRVRHALKTGSFKKLSKEVECDETWVGGKSKNMHGGKRAEMREKGFPKVCVMGFKERDGDVHLTIVPDNKAESLQGAVAEHVEAGAKLYTDQATGYNGVGETYDHATVNHKIGQYVDGDVSTNGMENVWSTFKRAYHGSYIHYSEQHADKYVAEEEFKVNNRTTDGERFAVMVASANGKRLDYRTLTESHLQTLERG